MQKKNLKFCFLILIIVFIGLFLRVNKVWEIAPFVGDQGRDYLAARDLLITRKITLVGPQTSIPWLYLGPFFYYFLAFFLLIGNFNPIWPVYGTIFFGILAIYLIYVLGKKFFNERVGLLAAFFYAISPYAVLQSRISLHPSILPVFVMLFLLALYYSFTFQESIRPPGRCLGQVGHLRGVLMLLSFFAAIQLHLSAILLIPIGFLTRERIMFPKSTKLLRLFLTAVFFLVLIKIYRNSPFTPITYWWLMFKEVFSYGNNFGGIIALAIVIVGVIRAISPTSPSFAKASEGYEGAKEIGVGTKIIIISLLVIICGLTVKNSPAEHPYNLFLPVIILFFSYGLSQFSKKGYGNIVCLIICAFFLISNFYGLMTTNYFSKIYGPGLSSRIKLAEFIVNDSRRNQFVLKRCGPLWDYPSTNMNYEYLVWWLNQSRRVEEQESISKNKLTYYILEPAGSWEGCKKVSGEVFNFDFAEVMKVKNN